MRIQKLEFLAFGPFTQKVLCFDQGREGLNIVFGPNEAGKSSALRGLRDALYGIHARTSDNFVHKHQDLRIGFSLLARDGSLFSAVRRKGNTKTLLDPATDEPIVEASLTRLLSNVPRDVYESMFGIDYQALVAGGGQITRLQGQIGETLFSAAGGITRLREVRQELDEQAEALFKAGGSKPKLNAALRDYAAAVKSVRDQRLATKEYDTLRKDHDATQRELAGVEASLRSVRIDCDRLERLDQALPQLALRRQCRESLAQSADGCVLRPGFDVEFRGVKRELDLAEQKLAGDAAKLEQIDAALQGLSPPATLLAIRDEIRQLSDSLGSYRKAQQDLHPLQRKYDQSRGEAEALLRRLRPDLAWEGAESLRLSPRDRGRLTKLAGEFTRLTTDLEQTADYLAKAEERLRSAQRDLGSLGVAYDVRDFRNVVKSIQELGPLEQRQRDAERKAARGFDVLRTSLTQLGRWSGSLEDLERLALPSLATIAAHERRIADATKVSDDARAQREQIDEQLGQIATQLATLHGVTGDLPTEDTVTSSRATRDVTWQVVRAAWQSGAIDPRQIEAVDPAASPTLAGLAECYERSVENADQVVDRVRREQQRIAEQARLVADQLRRHQDLARALQRLESAQESVARTAAEWEQLWRPLAIQSGTPAEMRDWRSEVEQIRKQLPDLRALATEAGEIGQQIAASRQRLDEQLAVAGQKPLADHDSLKTGVLRCEQWLADQTELAGRRLALEARSGELAGEIETLRGKRERLDEAELAWRRSWEAALQPLGVEPESTPATVEAFQRECDELFAKIREAEGPDGFRARIQGIHEDARNFAAHVERLAQVGDISAGNDPAETAQCLLDALRRGENVEARIADLEKQRQDAARKAVELRDKVQQHRVKLRSLCEEAGAAAPEELEACWRRSEERRSREARLDELETALLKLAGGRSLADLEEEAAGAESSELTRRIGELRDQIEQLDARRGQLREQLGRLGAELLKMDGGTQAVDANAQSQAMLAKIEDLAVEYARVKLASVVLRKAVDRFAERNKDPMLHRAGEYFAQLTEGSFTDLKVDYDDQDQPILVGRRSGISVPIAGMSEGTADQLYFAMRLAFLADWLERHEPLPIVVDDILIKFDDQRALATLKVLAEFSHRTQVILFTHHRHLVELAQANLPPASLFVHHL